jgi:hypothetical protein
MFGLLVVFCGVWRVIRAAKKENLFPFVIQDASKYLMRGFIEFWVLKCQNYRRVRKSEGTNLIFVLIRLHVS